MIQLLTFSRLSLLRENPDDGPMTEVANALSNVATTFHCHLLQSPGAVQLLDALGTQDQQERLRSALSDRSAAVRVLTGTAPETGQWPEWLCPEIQTASSPQAAAAALQWWGTKESRVEFRWQHIDVAGLECQSDWITSVLRVACDVISSSPDATVIVTSLSGESADCGRFESLLWEGTIRVPLWVGGGEMPPRQMPGPSGSHDVLETVLSGLGAPSEPSTPDSPIDLTKVSSMEVAAEDRRIRISGSRCAAIRTSEFMLVQDSEQNADRQVALYEKPHDLWNVHDVRREYPQVADDLLMLLTPGQAGAR